MAKHNVHVVKVLLKSGQSMTAAVTGFEATQKDDGSGYIGVKWNNVDREQFKTLKGFHRDLCKISSVNVAQIEGVTIIDEL